LREVANQALERSFATYVLQFKDGQTTATDISSLDPDDSDAAVSEWGGLAGFSSRFGESVRNAVNDVPGGAA
jgi:hypothetical protein